MNTEVQELESLPGPLITTDYQAQSVKSIKAIGFLPIPVRTFVRLTTETEESAQKLLEGDPYWGEKVSLEDYNAASLEGRINLAPFLYVMRHNGKIVGHEGRHRAGAVWREDPDASIWVAVILKNKDGYAVYYEEPRPSERKRYLGRDDLPPKLIGEFRPIRHKVDPFEFQPLWDVR